MSEHVQQWKDSIDSITKSFNDEFQILDKKELNWKPNPNTWSVAQIIEHLIVTNKSYYPIFEQLKSNNYKLPVMAKLSFLADVFGNLILKTVSPEYKRKTKTFPVWQPETGNIDTNILSEFSNEQKRLKDEIDDCKELIQQNKILSSPANKNIFYRIDKTFDILIAHEKRHFNQAVQVKKLIKN